MEDSLETLSPSLAGKGQSSIVKIVIIIMKNMALVCFTARIYQGSLHNTAGPKAFELGM